VTQYDRNSTARKKLLWKDVHVGEHFKYKNLLSVTKFMKEGWKLTGFGTEMTLTKREVAMKFDILIKTSQGILYYNAYFKRNAVYNAAIAAGKPKMLLPRVQC